MSNAPTTPAKRSARDADPADELPERFEPRREIARGGMGAVVEVFDRRLGRTVAVKQSLSDDADTRMRFEREIAITARLEHPSIVPVYDAGVATNGEPYYVMRRVTGAPLDELVERATTLDARLLLLPNVLAVADAIAHAHRRGVIHRDLKPTNVLVGELGETVVIDWGLAKLLDEDEPATSPIILDSGARRELATTFGAVIGTPGFMPPEQVLAKPVDARADVYALGATLFYVLAGRTPFSGDDQAIFEATLAGRVPSLTTLVPGVPPELVTIVETAMASDPAKRYLDAGGLGEDLRRFLGGQLVASHRYNTRQRLARWVRRHRGVVIASALGLAIAIAVATIAIVRVFDAQARTEAALASERTALANERARADELVVAEASAYLETDPTRAVATLLRLPPDSARWAALGPFVADARVRGVAFLLPDSAKASHLRFATDGTPRLLSGGTELRIHDLEARTTTRLVSAAMATMPGRISGAWVGPFVVALGNAFKPAVIDPATGARAPLAAHSVDGAPGRIAYLDDARQVFTLELDRVPPTAAAVPLAMHAPAELIELSPSGRYLTVWSGKYLEVFRRDGTAWTSILYDPTLSGVLDSFDPDEAHLLASSPGTDEIVDIDLAKAAVVMRWPAPSVPLVIATSHARYTIGFGANGIGVDRLALDGKRVHQLDIVQTHGRTMTRVRDTVAVLATPRRIEINIPHNYATLRPPIDVTEIAGDPSGRWLAGVTAEGILVWDLSQILPEITTVAGMRSLRIDDASTLVALRSEDTHTVSMAFHIASPFALDAGTPTERMPGYIVHTMQPAGPVVKRDNGLALVDAASNESWMIMHGVVADEIAIAPDRTFAIVSARWSETTTRLHRISLVVPPATPPAIHALTNARRGERARAPLDWDATR